MDGLSRSAPDWELGTGTGTSRSKSPLRSLSPSPHKLRPKVSRLPWEGGRKAKSMKARKKKSSKSRPGGSVKGRGKARRKGGKGGKKAREKARRVRSTGSDHVGMLEAAREGGGRSRGGRTRTRAGGRKRGGEEGEQEGGEQEGVEEGLRALMHVDPYHLKEATVVAGTADYSYEDNDALLQHSLELVPCKSCNRKFVRHRLEKHYSICSKERYVRPTFDSGRARKAGTRAAVYGDDPTPLSPSRTTPLSPSKPSPSRRSDPAGKRGRGGKSRRSGDRISVDGTTQPSSKYGAPVSRSPRRRRRGGAGKPKPKAANKAERSEDV